MEIKKNEIVYIQKRRRDDVGEIFEWNGKILRGIYHHASEMVKEFFESGFIGELVENNLFPETWITEYSSEDYGLVVEHKRIWPIIYPQEWSFSMLRDSALAVLKVAKIAKKYGYNMKDCHGFNVLIENNHPKFIDLGSFHKNKEGCSGWEPYKEFLRFYYYPLFTWKDGLEYISKLSIFSANLTPHNEHYIYKNRFLRYLPSSFVEKLVKFRFLISDIAVINYDKLERSFEKKNLSGLILFFKKLVNGSKLAISQDLEKLERKILSIKRKNTETLWKDYHTVISKKKSRFEQIIQNINVYCPDVKTAIDIAGNQGLFSSKVLKETNIERMICQDLDELAVDIGYTAHKGVSENISYVNYNAIAPIVKTTHPLPSERFKSDMVFSLALLHHLILSQGFNLDDILDEFGRYTNRYICIEFMPKGLWVSGAKVNIPDWYTVEWFREVFIKYFEVLKEEQIAENYIVFIGKKRT